MAHKTYKGKSIDMDQIAIANGKSVALGNAKMNARGDVLGEGGKVVKTREETTKEYYQQARKNVVDTDEPVVPVAPVAQDISLDDFDATDTIEPVAPVEAEAPVEVSKPKRRKKAPAKGDE